MTNLTDANKAVIAAAITVVSVVLQALISGAIDQGALATAVTGLIATVLVYFTPNKPKDPSAR